ncbi:hypothetical protein CEXT_558371 [Caerostris extrusa]|uniref:Uncharacterized protein n=1 Tax=Caerostris extrusa TaxID=172846 RepID=A0AAV4Q2E3_CAEEX|nr:hypothetical protein CEXT_558371 [Caerostris extrusa]
MNGIYACCEFVTQIMTAQITVCTGCVCGYSISGSMRAPPSCQEGGNWPGSRCASGVTRGVGCCVCSDRGESGCESVSGMHATCRDSVLEVTRFA